MASNNYAEVITDSTKAQQVVAEFESMAEQGYSFKVLQFNPELDRFEVSCWRQSNFPTLLDVEASGTAMDGAAMVALWKSNCVCAAGRKASSLLPIVLVIRISDCLEKRVPLSCDVQTDAFKSLGRSIFVFQGLAFEVPKGGDFALLVRNVQLR